MFFLILSCYIDHNVLLLWLLFFGQINAAYEELNFHGNCSVIVTK